MVNFDPNITSMPPAAGVSVGKAAQHLAGKAGPGAAKEADFANTMKAVGQYLSKVDDLQQSSDVSIKDLLAGKSDDITSVVSAVAKADISFKLLVGVRNKLIEAYQQTMNMPL